MFKKPSTKSVTSAAVQIGSGIAGAKLSDGVVAVLPDSLGKFKKPGLAVVALVVAASINPSTTAGEAAQAAFAGMAIKQGMDAVTEAITPMITPKDNTKVANKFLNAVVGHNATSTAVAAEARFALNSPWAGQEPMYELATPKFAGV